MNLKVWLKSKAADRVLLPLRRQLIEHIDQGASVFEVGCGTGDLLFRAAPRIRSGHGVDLDPHMIAFAESKRQDNNLAHLTFECTDALHAAPRHYDISTSTLCLHELPAQTACDLLRKMVSNSKMTLIADFAEAESTFGRISIEFDELLSGHYRNYRRYRRNGEIPSYADTIGVTVCEEITSVVDGIRIWRITE